MPTLSTQLRCGKCGSKLSPGDRSACPTCHADLTQSGVWSELIEWGETRRKGRARYVWGRWVLWLGLTMALGLSAGRYWHFGDTSIGFHVTIWSTSLLGAYLGGRITWRSAEREFAAANRQASNGEAGVSVNGGV